MCLLDFKQTNIFYITEFYDRVDGDLSMGFGGLDGRGRKQQDPPIERDLFLSLEEVFHGCTKKMKISRRVGLLKVPEIPSKFQHMQLLFKVVL